MSVTVFIYLAVNKCHCNTSGVAMATVMRKVQQEHPPLGEHPPWSGDGDRLHNALIAHVAASIPPRWLPILP